PPPSWQALAPAPSLPGGTSSPRILLGLAGGGAVTALGVRPGEHHAQQTQHGDANQQDHTKPDDGEADSQKRPGDVEQHAVKDRTTPTMASVNTASEIESRSLPDTVVVRRGRVVFKSRRPAAAMLRATGAPFDGGFFADALAGRSDDILDAVTRYLRDPELRSTLPPARR